MYLARNAFTSMLHVQNYRVQDLACFYSLSEVRISLLRILTTATRKNTERQSLAAEYCAREYLN